ncbi:hypothetical protein ADL26_20510, partial [Thermoactinomyces vulgaris]
LGGGLLVAVLPQVGLAEFHEGRRIGGGEGLRDDDEADRVRRAARVGAGGRDGLAGPVEVVPQLVSARSGGQVLRS